MLKFINRIYSRVLEFLLFTIGDLLIKDKYIKSLRNWRRISQLSEYEINKLSVSNLEKILKYSVEKIPYYKKYDVLENNDTIFWLKKFPIMTKSGIKENINNLTNVNTSGLIKVSSSGSSGESTIVYTSKKERGVSRAIQTMWWEWSGWFIGKKMLQTGMTVNRGLEKSVKDFLFRTEYYNAYGLSENDTLSLINSKRNKRMWHLAGYASSLYILAKIANENNINNVKFENATSLGDKMFPHYRKEIEKAFNCKVYDTYGCSEGLMIAAQKDLEYYYIMSPHIYLELLDENGDEVRDGELGHVVVTRLDNYSMPLIRYDTGDLAIKLPRDKYPKNRDFNFPLLERIIGRDTDIVRTESGKYLIVHYFTAIFEKYLEIKQFRIVQKRLSGISIEYISGDGFKSSYLNEIENTIISHLDEGFVIQWIEVSTIPNTPSGKPQIIKSLLSNNKLNI
jgi:phenylacetate-CoA ligase